MPTGRASLMGEVPLIRKDAENLLQHQALQIINEVYSHLKNLNQQIENTESTFLLC